MASNAEYTTLFKAFGFALSCYRRVQAYLRDHQEAYVTAYPRYENYDVGDDRSSVGVTDWKFSGYGPPPHTRGKHH